jgi:hypothetical protein
MTDEQRELRWIVVGQVLAVLLALAMGSSAGPTAYEPIGGHPDRVRAGSDQDRDTHHRQAAPSAFER